MRVQHVGYRIRGFYRMAALGHLWEMTPKDAQRRLDIPRFWDKHGLAAIRDAFSVFRRTRYRWKEALWQAGGNPAALKALPCTPKRQRIPKTDPRFVAEIRRSPSGSSPTTHKRPHHSLGQRSPLSSLLKHQPERQRYWTHTGA